ncbi:aldehyde dehydrogenase family protein [bacterium]|nr:aldehyde dehydrogenase family protein [bacterium]
MQINSYIDNAFYQSGAQFIKLNPYTLQKLHDVQSCDLMGTVAAIQAANKAFVDWKASSLDERINLVEKFKKIITENKDQYAALEALDQALPLWFVKKSSIDMALQSIDEQVAAVKAMHPNSGIQYSPVGVIAIVASWNLSLRLILDRLVPAILAGNAVVVKISSQSPVTAFILADILKKSEALAGLVNVIVTDDAEVKKIIVSHPGVKAVSFTGNIHSSSEILALVNKTSLQSFKKIQISSGTKNSAAVIGEPTSENFNDIMNSFMLGQGQMAWNSSRLFIVEKHEQLWEERIAAYLNSLKPSESIEDNSVWTPCLKKESFDKFDEIKHMALDDKAKLLQTGFVLNDEQKKNFLPAVFTKDMSRCSTLQQDQIHSPFFILSTVKYPFDIPKYSNVSYFGFAAHLWGEKEKLTKVADALDVGLVSYNRSSVDVAGAVSGVKQSGFGLQDFQSFGVFYSNVKKLT